MDRDTLELEYAPVFDLRAGVLVYIPREDVGVRWPDSVVVAGTYVGTEEFHIVENVALDRLELWMGGDVPIQDALPELPVADRLFIQCGSKAFEYED